MAALLLPHGVTASTSNSDYLVKCRPKVEPHGYYAYITVGKIPCSKARAAVLAYEKDASDGAEPGDLNGVACGFPPDYREPSQACVVGSLRCRAPPKGAQPMVAYCYTLKNPIPIDQDFTGYEPKKFKAALTYNLPPGN